jgi:hypothetical protein
MLILDIKEEKSFFSGLIDQIYKRRKFILFESAAGSLNYNSRSTVEINNLKRGRESWSSTTIKESPLLRAMMFCVPKPAT